MGALFLRTLNWTLRWERPGFEEFGKDWPAKEPRIIAFWHGQQLCMAWSYLPFAKRKTKKPFIALISQSPDGRMIAKAMRLLGIGSVAGSSSRRGIASMYELIDLLKNGNHIAITPDGPKGPPKKLKGGVIRIAQKSGAAIYPTAISAKNKWNFRSWDSMILPKPFSRAVMIMGSPISIPESLNAQELIEISNQVQSSLEAVSKRAEEYEYA